MGDIQVHVANVVGSCDGFISDMEPAGKMRQIVVSPLKVTFGENDQTYEKQARIINGCNMGENCLNADCWFGAIQRDKKRAEAKERKERRV